MESAVPPSIRAPDHRPRRHQRRHHGTPDHNLSMQDRLRSTHHGRHPQFPLRPSRQKGQIASPNHGQVDGQYASDGRV